MSTLQLIGECESCLNSTTHQPVVVVTTVDGWMCDNGTTTTALGPNPRLSHSTPETKAVFLTIGSIGFTLNVLVLCVIASYRPMRQRLTNAFIANLAAIDTVAALFLILHNTIEYNPSQPLNPNDTYDQLVCRLWYSKVWLWAMLTSSSYGIVFLTFERYLGVVHPLLHKTFLTRPKVLAMLAMAWVIGLTFNAASLISTTGVTSSCYCTKISAWENKSLTILTFVVFFFGPLVLLLYFYGHMAVVMSRRLTADAADEPLIRIRDQLERARKVRMNVIKTLATVAVFFVLCWSFNQVFYLVHFFGRPNNDFAGTFFNVTLAVIYLNSCINPIIYTIRYEQFQQGLQWFVCQSWRRRDAADDFITHSNNATPGNIE